MAACFIYETKFRDFRSLFHFEGTECVFLKVLPYIYMGDKISEPDNDQSIYGRSFFVSRRRYMLNYIIALSL